jgi:CheY-like chemotaxis protein
MNTPSIPMLIDSEDPIRILIVDDDKVIADLSKDVITKIESAREVTVCYDGDEAVDRINNSAFDLIITDLVMPRLGFIS